MSDYLRDCTRLNRMRVLGIDPGSRVTGFGVIDVERNRVVYVASGCVRAVATSFPLRLKIIFEGVSEIVNQYRPDEMAIEKVFVQRNVDSALKLGQARGAALCAAIAQSITIFEYSPTEIKQAVVGRGRAEKTQVQHMVTILLGLDGTPPSDAADALACALCHYHTNKTAQYISSPANRQGSRL